MKSTQLLNENKMIVLQMKKRLSGCAFSGFCSVCLVVLSPVFAAFIWLGFLRLLQCFFFFCDFSDFWSVCLIVLSRTEKK